MQKFCHTCGGDLPAGSGESPFCPHCGAPQLTLSLDYQSPETGGEPVLETLSAASAATPAPRLRQIDWQMAIRCALAVAGVAAVLCVAAMRVTLLSPVSSLWILCGSLITLGLYQRQRPKAWMDVGVGARIGLVVGLCLALGLAIAFAAAGLVARFGLHSMAGFDAEMAARTDEAVHNSTSPVPPDMLRFLATPEFRGGIMLGGLALFSAFLLVMSMLGGAFAGLLRMRRKAAV